MWTADMSILFSVDVAEEFYTPIYEYPEAVCKEKKNFHQFSYHYLLSLGHQCGISVGGRVGGQPTIIIKFIVTL